MQSVFLCRDSLRLALVAAQNHRERPVASIPTRELTPRVRLRRSSAACEESPDWGNPRHDDSPSNLTLAVLESRHFKPAGREGQA